VQLCRSKLSSWFNSFEALMKRSSFALVLLIFSALAGQSQTPNSLQYLDSSKTLNVQTTTNVQDSSPLEMKLDLKMYSSLMVDNFKRQAFFPLCLDKKGWLKFGGYALISSAVALANQPVKEFSIKLHDNNPTLADASSFITKFGYTYGMYTLAGLVTYSAFSKNTKFRTTTLLATQSFILANVLGGGVKTLTSVQGPFYTDPLTNRMGPIFHGPFYTLKKAPNGEKLQSTNYVSFPSGHTFSAFSIATVYAMQYRDKPIIPIFCYSLATLVGLSRLTENRHWAMDIIPGALLGYYSGKQVVSNFHRFSKKKQRSENAKKLLSINFGYANAQIVPRLLYQF
jgi:membrane-associated phospholipid phosphatase